MSDLTKKLTEIIGLLEPLSSEDRHRVVKSAMAFIGEPSVDTGLLLDTGASTLDGVDLKNDGSESNYSPIGQIWMKKNDVTPEILDQVFHPDSKGVLELIATPPGRNKRELTRNVYILVGLANNLGKGVSDFTDEEARSWCQKAGCFDLGNHASIMKTVGNELTGNKQKGWVVTAPGLKRAAEIVNEIIAASK